ncbi:MAG: class I SAM-dependent methyltransferase [Candidatus Omnitrophica bacterium]|nr:class I SAM-dependent methyltransferase [Candidatus Omnitrophota bacterium]
MNNIKETINTYSLLWQKSGGAPARKWHFNAMQEVIPEPIVRGNAGIEVGSGCGYDTYIMAKTNPAVRFVSMDISDGIYKTGRLVSGLGNVMAIKCSAMNIAIKGSIFDFAYSFGVLHHTPDPGRCLREISRVLKKGSPAFIYLYEDHSNNIFKYAMLKIITALRRITTRLPRKALYAMAWVLSPLVFIFFTLPANVMKNFKFTRNIASKMPFNFGSGPFSLRGDLYDRFGAPVEYRFSRAEIEELFAKCGFSEIRITRLRDTAGWVAWGYKS